MASEEQISRQTNTLKNSYLAAIGLENHFCTYSNSFQQLDQHPRHCYRLPPVIPWVIEEVTRVFWDIPKVTLSIIEEECQNPSVSSSILNMAANSKDEKTRQAGSYTFRQEMAMAFVPNRIDSLHPDSCHPDPCLATLSC